MEISNNSVFFLIIVYSFVVAGNALSPAAAPAPAPAVGYAHDRLLAPAPAIATDSNVELEEELKFTRYDNTTLVLKRPPRPKALICRRQPYLRYTRVETTGELMVALNNAQAGDLIELRPGVYGDPDRSATGFENKHGLARRPIILCGPRGAVITGRSAAGRTRYAFHIQRSSYIRLRGFTLRGGMKGLIADRSHHLTIDRLWVRQIDHEAIRLRDFSSDNVVKRCRITDIGLTNPGIGEGIYIGTAVGRSPQPDRSNNNKILHNRIGPGVSAEMIDIKENTEGGLIEGNIFDGSGLSGQNYADSWVDVKGSGWVVRRNQGWHTLKDGFQTHDRHTPLSGERNVFEENTCHMGSAPGVCISLHCAEPGGANGCSNRVACSNVVAGGTWQGLSNVPCAH